jgi:hypothetical protein
MTGVSTHDPGGAPLLFHGLKADVTRVEAGDHVSNENPGAGFQQVPTFFLNPGTDIECRRRFRGLCRGFSAALRRKIGPHRVGTLVRAVYKGGTRCR